MQTTRSTQHSSSKQPPGGRKGGGCGELLVGSTDVGTTVIQGAARCCTASANPSTHLGRHCTHVAAALRLTTPMRCIWVVVLPVAAKQK
jgi:hypothetical protein